MTPVPTFAAAVAATQPDQLDYVDHYPTDAQYTMTPSTTTALEFNDPHYYDYYAYGVADPNNLRPTFSASSNSCSSNEEQPGLVEMGNYHHNGTTTNAVGNFTCYNEGGQEVHNIHEYEAVIVESPTHYHIHDEFVH